MDALTQEAMRAGPIVVIMWLLLNRLERRFGSFEQNVGTRLLALEVAAADRSHMTEVANLKERLRDLQSEVANLWRASAQEDKSAS